MIKVNRRLVESADLQNFGFTEFRPHGIESKVPNTRQSLRRSVKLKFALELN